MGYEVKTIEKDLDYLRQISKEIDFKKDTINEYVEILEDYCKNNKVFAMAAVQLGIPKRMMYVRSTDCEKYEDMNWNEGLILINPKIKKRKGIASYWEACASCLDNLGFVLRPYKLVVEYKDLKNKRHAKTFKGFPAVVISHELDHLDGVLHMDKALELYSMSAEERAEFRKEHPYKVYDEEKDFLELESAYKKKSVKGLENG